MTDVYTQDLISQIGAVTTNPMAIQRIMLNAIDAASNGTLDVVDPSIPFVFHLESTACVGAAAMMLNRKLSRQQYPTLSLTQEDLYRWMSDKDYANRFATPATADFLLMFSLEEVKARAVPTGANGVKRLTIPRNTVITVNGYDFAMQYPIDILVMPHGDLQITYDSSLPSPLQVLNSNIVPMSTMDIPDPNGSASITFLFLKIEAVNQMSVKSRVGNISLSRGFKTSYAYSNYFYAARVYQSNSAGWNEIDVTYSDQVFDPTKPTVYLRVNSDTSELEVSVPQIYLTNGMLTNELRIDIYTTQGPVVVNLSNITTDNFVAKWQDFDNSYNGIYWAPLLNFQNKGINSPSDIAGGQGPLDLATLRQNVINNTMGAVNIPITNNYVGSYASNLGFGIVTDVDVLTNRQFLVTRGIDPPTDGSLVTGAGVTMQTFRTTMSALASISTVADNGNRMTLLPDTLYENNNAIITLVQQASIDALNALDPETRVATINNSGFLYTPFHYVLDANNNTFEARPYYLDNPGVTLKTYVSENSSTDLTVATATYKLVRMSAGYQLQLLVNSSDTFVALNDSSVFAQLAFIPVGETTYAYLNGILQPTKVNGQRVWTFDIGTNYDIDENDNIILTNFSMFNEGPRQHTALLNQTFQLIYGVLDYNVQGQTTSSIDTIIGAQLFNGVPTGVTQEMYQMELGIALDNLWKATRSVATQEVYATHTANVPLLYEQNVYLNDPVSGTPAFTMVNGVPQFTILHPAGSAVLDTNGNQVYANRIGDPILDGQNQPITILTRDMAREVDILMVDGVYWWATNQAALNYKFTIAQTVADWIANQVVQLQNVALENTVVYFYPKASVGLVDVTTEYGKTATIDSEQSFDVVYYCSQDAATNISFTTALEQSTKEIIAQQLQSDLVSIENITAALRQNVNITDVSVIKVSGLGGANNFSAVKINDASQSLTVGKVLVALPDGTLTVQDSINVSFPVFS